MTLLKDTLITTKGTHHFPAGGLYQRGSDYINWKAGSSTITLDGDFTVADLQWLIDYMLSKQSDSAIEEVKWVQ